MSSIRDSAAKFVPSLNLTNEAMFIISAAYIGLVMGYLLKENDDYECRVRKLIASTLLVEDYLSVSNYA